ncbi:MAG: PQQ-binding-like beta-propeller repeat protein [Geminicoccaceae bacterium]
MRLRRRLFLGASLAALTGCGEDGWFGDPEKRLPGDRKSVILLDETPTADERLANLEVVLPPPEANRDWPMSGGTPSHAPGHLDVPETISQAWSTDIGAGSDRRERLLASPIVGGGRVFTVDADGVVGAFSTADGRKQWTAEPDEIERADRLRSGGLAFAGDRLFVTFAHGDVLALDGASGSEIWRQRLQAPLRANPTVAEDLVLVVTADNQTFALATADGTIQWRHAGTFEQASLLGGAAPAVDQGTVIVAYSSGEVFALGLVDGSPIWTDSVLRPRRTLAIGSISDIVGDPVISEGRVIVAGNSGEMASFDLLQGGRVWDLQITSRNTPWVVGDFIFALTDRNYVVCLLRQGGRIRWVQALDAVTEGEKEPPPPGRWVGPILAGDRLVLASSRGEVASLSPYTGEVLGKAEVGGPVSLSPIAAERTVFFLTDSGTLLAFR